MKKKGKIECCFCGRKVDESNDWGATSDNGRFLCFDCITEVNNVLESLVEEAQREG